MSKIRGAGAAVLLVAGGLTGCTTLGACRDGHLAATCASAMSEAGSAEGRFEALQILEGICTAPAPSSDRSAACVAAARELILEKPPWLAGPKEKEFRRLAGAPNPARAAELLGPVCSPADFDQDACVYLAALSWVGFGVPRDRALGRVYLGRAVEAQSRRLHVPAPAPGNELWLVGQVLSNLASDELWWRLLADVRTRVGAHDLEGAVEPFLTLLSLPHPAATSPASLKEPGSVSAFVPALWDTAVSREIAAGRVAVGLGRAEFIAQHLNVSGMNGGGRLEAAKKAALEKLSSLPSPISAAATHFREALAAALGGGSRAMTAGSARAPDGRPRWEFRSPGSACAPLVEQANAAVAGRTGPVIPVALDGLVCTWDDRRWSTTEEYTDRRWVGGSAGHEEVRTESHWAPCPGYSATHAMCVVTETGPVTVGATEPTLSVREATREVRHQILHAVIHATARVKGARDLDWSFAVDLPEQVIHVGDGGPQEFLAFARPETERAAITTLVRRLDEQATPDAIWHLGAPASPEADLREGILFEKAATATEDDPAWTPILAQYGLRPWHFRAMAQGRPPPNWLYGYDDPPPR